MAAPLSVSMQAAVSVCASLSLGSDQERIKSTPCLINLQSISSSWRRKTVESRSVINSYNRYIVVLTIKVRYNTKFQVLIVIFLSRLASCCCARKSPDGEPERMRQRAKWSNQRPLANDIKLRAKHTRDIW